MKARDRRTLVAGAAVVVLAFLGLRVVPWGWRTVTGDQSELLARAELLGRMQTEVGSVAALEDSAAVVKSRIVQLASKLLAGRTRADATADLAARLSAAANRHRVRISRKDPGANTARPDGLVRVALRATLESDSRGLLGFLGALSQEPAVLVADSLRIAVADPLVSRDRPELLRTEVTVSGWYQSAGGSR